MEAIYGGRDGGGGGGFRAGGGGGGGAVTVWLIINSLHTPCTCLPWIFFAPEQDVPELHQGQVSRRFSDVTVTVTVLFCFNISDFQ